MKQSIGVLLVAALVHGIMTPGFAADYDPDVLLKSLLRVQDRIAAGDRSAIPLQGHLQKLLNASIAENELSEPNIRAVVILSVIGGGSPIVSGALREIAQVGTVADLVLALDHYQSGRRNQALEKFSRVNADELDTRIAPFVAFAQGNLNASVNPKKATGFFNRSRLLAPGTLLEEASLRKLMGLYIATQNPTQFIAVARQYTRRFIESPYRSQFLTALMSGIGSMRRSITFDQIDELAGLMPPSFAASYYQHLIRRSVVAGQLKLASHSIDQLKILLTQSNRIQTNEQQLALFSIISRLHDQNPNTISRELSALEVDKLSSKDSKLLDATRSMVEAITAPIEANVLDEKANEPAQAQNEPKAEKKKLTKAGSASFGPNSSDRHNLELDEAEIGSFVQSADKNLAIIDKMLNE